MLRQSSRFFLVSSATTISHTEQQYCLYNPIFQQDKDNISNTETFLINPFMHDVHLSGRK